jgi:hypothetical protein
MMAKGKVEPLVKKGEVPVIGGMNLHINARLEMWARWRCGSGSANYSPYPIYNMPKSADAHDAPPRRSFVPIVPIECSVTDKCIVALPPELRDVVEVFYLWTVPMDQKAKALGCCEKTVYNRLYRAQDDIMGYVQDLSAGVAVVPWTVRNGDVQRALARA